MEKKVETIIMGLDRVLGCRGQAMIRWGLSRGTYGRN